MENLLSKYDLLTSPFFAILQFYAFLSRIGTFVTLNEFGLLLLYILPRAPKLSSLTMQPTRDCVAKTLKRLEEKIHGRVSFYILSYLFL